VCRLFDGIIFLMLAYVLYNKDTENERPATDLAKRLDNARIATELLDADSARGIQLAEHYELLGRPAVLLVRDDGSPIQVWQGIDGLPAPSDVAYLAHQ
jgi:hypothetical protein